LYSLIGIVFAHCENGTLLPLFW